MQNTLLFFTKIIRPNLQNDEKFLFFKDDKNKTECGLKPFDASMETVPTPSPFHHLILNP
ncbi:MAG TPA: hypothetical protein VIQ00_08050 [Chitinophagaceae bacterium]